MTNEEGKPERIRELRKRRIRMAEEREKLRKRSEMGNTVVEKINAALGSSLMLDDFMTNTELRTKFASQPDLRNCAGLVAAYSSEADISEIVSCCDLTLRPMSGMIGFDDYAFVGTAKVKSITLTAILEAAKMIHDSVFFCPDGYDSIALLDHYQAGGVAPNEEYTFIVQGKKLEKACARCFGKRPKSC